LLREHGAEDTLDALVSGGPREIQMPGTEPDAAESPPAFLIVGDADHTELLQGCIKETGYVEPVFYADPAEELKEKQATLEATLAWIECARQNGYPDIRDPAAPVADQRITTPTAVLPLETTTQDLERLLSECPADVGDASLDGIIVSAEIGFDAPGFRGDLSEDAEIEPETADRLVALQNIIAESVSAH
jgi:hypothetical protein